MPGGGGTVMVPGSQEWVRRRLEAAGREGIVHQELNAYCVSQMIEKVRAGRVMIPASVAAVAADPAEDATPAKRKHDDDDEDDEDDDKIVLHQICGKAGDVVLMHPWLVHSGTTNLRSAPRLMANGMVRVRAETFEREGCRVLLGGGDRSILKGAFPKKKRRRKDITGTG